jgi:hypothetical protein
MQQIEQLLSQSTFLLSLVNTGRPMISFKKRDYPEILEWQLLGTQSLTKARKVSAINQIKSSKNCGIKKTRVYQKHPYF